VRRSRGEASFSGCSLVEFCWGREVSIQFEDAGGADGQDKEVPY